MTPGPLRPTVSVIIPALNEEGCVAAAVRSARAAGADQVIVVDGGSGDGTVAAASGLADAVLTVAPGRALQMNAGAAAADGDVLLFLHADTVMPAGSIELVKSACREQGLAGGACTVELGVSHGAPAGRHAILRLIGRMINVRARLFRSYTGDQGMFVRRDIFDAVGRYPEIPLMEDVVLSRAVARRGKTALVPARLMTSARRWEARGPARTILLMWGLRLAHRLGMSPARCAAIYRGECARATPR